MHAGLMQGADRSALEAVVGLSAAGERYVVQQKRVRVLAGVDEVFALFTLDCQVGGAAAVYRVHLADGHIALKKIGVVVSFIV